MVKFDLSAKSIALISVLAAGFYFLLYLVAGI